MTTRRDFLSAAAVSLFAFTQKLSAQETHNMPGGGTMTGPMDEGNYKPVRLPSKPNAVPSMTDAQRDAMEHEIHCQCGCTLDIYTCRTTDFTCSVSPAMHRDVMSLIEGGYNKSEIMSAFVNVYGEKALMAPVKEGFNWAGYVVPFVVVGVGAVVILRNLRKWTKPSESATT